MLALSSSGLTGRICCNATSRADAIGEGARRRSPVHAAPLGGATLIVAQKMGVENRLHLLDGFEPGAASLDPEVLVEQRAVQPLDDTVRLRALDPGGAVLDVLELQKQLVRMLVGPAA